MKATELRIGNLFIVNGTVIEVNEIKQISVDGKSKINGWDEEECNPVPLTEEWLLKLGFSGVDFEKSINNFRIIFEKRHDGWSYQLGFDKDWLPCVGIDYVHQLQNLYFALTGEELTIKE